MNSEKLTENEKPKELEHAEHLIKESKFAEAFQILKEVGQNERVPLYHRISCYRLQCRVLMWQGKYSDCYKIAKLAYKDSLGLEKDLSTIDALNIMALSKIILREPNKGIKLVQQAENLLKTYPKDNSPRYNMVKALIAQNKGYYYVWSYKDINRGLKFLEENLLLRKQFGSKVEIAMGFFGVGSVLSGYKGELDRAIEYLKQGLTFANESGNKWPIIMILNALGYSYYLKGELDHAIEYFQNGLEVAREINNNSLIMHTLMDIGNIYIEKGEFGLVFDYLEQSLAICEEFGGHLDKFSLLSMYFQLYIAKGDLEQAQKYFQRLEHLNKQINNRVSNLSCLFNNALLLKASHRFRNKIEAEEILKQILEEENLPIDNEVYTLIQLCDLFFTELRVTNEPEILEEIKPVITRLIEVAEKSNSSWILCETYLLQAKITLLELDLKKAQRFLTQAQQIAQRYGLNQLTMKINYENDELIKKLDLWKDLKRREAPMNERLGLARLDDQIEEIIKKRLSLTSHIREEKIAIHKEKKICLVCRGIVLRYSYLCECGAIYCEHCVRALTNLENVCWACNIPIDYCKPVKLYKEEELGEKKKKSKM
ncbi:MAG: tetratricopeptide repeat protein [Promethearchaeota archaeon]